MITFTERAARVKGKVSAARMWEDLNFRAETSSAPPEQIADMHRAIDVLERDFPWLEDMTPGEAEDFAQGLGHGSREPDAQALSELDDNLPKAAAGKPPAKAGGQRGGTRSAKAARRGSGGRSSSRRRSGGSRRSGAVGPRGRRAFRETGIPSAARSGASVAYQAVGLTLMFSLLYLLLSDAQRRRNSAAVTIAEGFAGGVRAFISPHRDPIAGVGAAASSTAGGASSTTSTATAPAPSAPPVAQHPGRRRPQSTPQRR